jgi:tetratricopeptide (TPR) repeat protein
LLDAGIVLLESGVKLLERIPISDEAGARLYAQIGKLRATRNFQGVKDYGATFSILTTARHHADLSASDARIADVLDLIGLTHYYRKLRTGEGTFDTAAEYFQQALARREFINDRRGIAETLFHLGLIYQNTDAEFAAAEMYARSAEIAYQDGYKLELSYAVRHLGAIAKTKGDLDTARNYAEQSLALREEIGFAIFLPFSHIALGDVCAAQGDWEAAGAHFEQAHRMNADTQLHTQTIFALLALARVSENEGNHAQARRQLEEALGIARRIDDHPLIETVTERLSALQVT